MLPLTQLLTTKSFTKERRIVFGNFSSVTSAIRKFLKIPVLSTKSFCLITRQDGSDDDLIERKSPSLSPLRLHLLYVENVRLFVNLLVTAAGTLLLDANAPDPRSARFGTCLINIVVFVDCGVDVMCCDWRTMRNFPRFISEVVGNYSASLFSYPPDWKRTQKKTTTTCKKHFESINNFSSDVSLCCYCACWPLHQLSPFSLFLFLFRSACLQ